MIENTAYSSKIKVVRESSEILRKMHTEQTNFRSIKYCLDKKTPIRGRIDFSDRKIPTNTWNFLYLMDLRCAPNFFFRKSSFQPQMQKCLFFLTFWLSSPIIRSKKSRFIAIRLFHFFPLGIVVLNSNLRILLACLMLVSLALIWNQISNVMKSKDRGGCVAVFSIQSICPGSDLILDFVYFILESFNRLPGSSHSANFACSHCHFFWIYHIDSTNTNSDCNSIQKRRISQIHWLWTLCHLLRHWHVYALAFRRAMGANDTKKSWNRIFDWNSS